MYSCFYYFFFTKGNLQQKVNMILTIKQLHKMPYDIMSYKINLNKLDSVTKYSCNKGNT